MQAIESITTRRLTNQVIDRVANADLTVKAFGKMYKRCGATIIDRCADGRYLVRRCKSPGYVDGFCTSHCDCDEHERHRVRQRTRWEENRAKRSIGARSAWLLDDGTEVFADGKKNALKLAGERKLMSVRLRW